MGNVHSMTPNRPPVPYERERVDADGGYSRPLRASASSQVPADIRRIRGMKLISAPSDWQIDRAADSGFACLGCSMPDPQRHQLDYKATGSGGALDQFRAVARGDIDGDGALSTFAIEGRGTAGDAVTIAPSILETAPDE